MRVASLHIENFKRFTSLDIAQIPESTKLVVLIGSNGSGKSSLFDAFIHWHRLATRIGYNDDAQYYNKNDDKRDVQVFLHGGEQPRKNSLYVRTAYRNDADFSSSRIQNQPDPIESPHFSRLIEDDKTVSGNYQRLLLQSITSLYSAQSKNKTGEKILEELIGGIRHSMRNVFGDLMLNAITDPLGSDSGSGAFYFQKGLVSSYHYKNLSGGEKAAFDLVLDVHLKKHLFPRAIYCIDEVDLHLHTKTQGIILKELFRIVPNESQLWVTTHSLGVLRAGQEIEASWPGSVCIIDFDAVHPDETSQLTPSNLNKAAWEKMLSVALDDLSERIAPEIVIICEGTSIGKRRNDFDASIYNHVLGKHQPGLVFISGGLSGSDGGSQDVQRTGNVLRAVSRAMLPKTTVISLIDRDSKSPVEVEEFESTNHGIVLSKRNLESFLFADDVLQALSEREGKGELCEDAQSIRATALGKSQARGNAPDDLKSAAGEIYVELTRLLGLQSPGETKDSFMRDTLAPLIVPGMDTYERLKAAIVDRAKQMADNARPE